MNRRKRILLCESRNLSYASSGFFLRQIRTALEESGVETEYFHLAEDRGNIDELERFIGQAFDAVLDINSHLPFVVTEDGSYLLDRIAAPFYNYLVDHPLHLHPILDSPASNHHILCLDPVHQAYIGQYYPGIRSCHVLPLAGSRARVEIPFSERSWQIYFPGTYVPLSEYEAKLKQEDVRLLPLAQEYLSEADGGRKTEIPEWIQGNYGGLLSAEELFRHCRYVDRYVREVYRHRIIEKIAVAGFSLHVTGSYWEYYEGRAAKNLIVHPSCAYPEMLEHMADSQIVVNIQPLFRHAPHDRILCGMANGAVVFTDSCSCLQDCLTAGKQYISYDIHSPDTGIKLLRRKLKNSGELQRIAAEGQDYVTGHFLWQEWAKQFLEMIDKEI